MTSHLTRAAFALIVGLAMLGAEVAAQSKDPLVGTWRLNVAKSKYNPGPAPKSVTSTWEAAGKGYKVMVRNEPATGAPFEYSYTVSADGTDAKVSGTNPNADAIAMTRIDANTFELVSKRNGKTTIRQRSVISPDGKTRTITTTGVDANGQKVNNVTVLEKS